MKARTVLIGTMLFGNAVIIILIVAGIYGSSDIDTKELKLVHVVARHGIRTPVDTYPKDPYLNAKFEPNGWGQLTNEGKLNLHEFGKFLRERYDKFLGKYYYPDRYYTQSTDVDRTKMSVQLINSGLWTPEPPQKWGPLDWQPLPVHSEPLHQDNLLLVRRPCPQFNIELEKVKNLPEVRKKLIDLEPVFQNLSDFTGKSIKDFDDVQDVYTTLQAEEAFNLALPTWTKGFYPDKMKEPAEFSYVLSTYNSKLKRLKGGVLLKKLLGDWRDVRNGTLKPKDRLAFLYGGHDSTISNLLGALNVFKPEVPPFGAAILLELYYDTVTKLYGVEIYYKNSPKEEPRQLVIPGCDSFCVLSDLEEFTKANVPNNWEEECKSDDPNYVPPPPKGP